MKPEIIASVQMPCCFAKPTKTGGIGKHTITIGSTNQVMTYIHVECEATTPADVLSYIPHNHNTVHCGHYREWLLAIADSKTGPVHQAEFDDGSVVKNDKYAKLAFTGTPLQWLFSDMLSGNIRNSDIRREPYLTTVHKHYALTHFVQAYANSALPIVYKDGEKYILGTWFSSVKYYNDTDPVAYRAREMASYLYSMATTSMVGSEKFFCLTCRDLFSTNKRGREKHVASGRHNTRVLTVLQDSMTALDDALSSGPLITRRNKCGELSITTPFFQRNTAGNLAKYKAFYGDMDITALDLYYAHKASKDATMEALMKLGFTRVDFRRFVAVHQASELTNDTSDR